MLEGTSSLNNRTAVISTHCRCGFGCIIVSLGAEFSSVLQVWLAFEPDDPFGHILIFWDSDERLLAYARRFVCSCTTLHAAIGREEPSKCAQVWPLALCRGIARGCVDVLKDKHALHALILQKELFYFEVAAGTLICMSWDYFR